MPMEPRSDPSPPSRPMTTDGRVTYDSTSDTLAHIDRVRSLLMEVVDDLCERAFIHDRSKLFPPEKPAFDELTPRLKGLTYGSDEYKACLAQMRPALQHHYENNRHHPEHFRDGINDMTLVDLLEMLCDWKAAGERHADGNIYRSIDINRERFGISEQLCKILHNTAAAMGHCGQG